MDIIDSDRERKIISECKAGQSEAFSQMYDLYVKKIYKFIFYKTFHTQTAEDLTSEVFYKALKNIDKFDFKYKFSTWIYKIAQNAITDYFRTYKKTINPPASLEFLNPLVNKSDAGRMNIY